MKGSDRSSSERQSKEASCTRNAAKDRERDAVAPLTSSSTAFRARFGSGGGTAALSESSAERSKRVSFRFESHDLHRCTVWSSQSALWSAVTPAAAASTAAANARSCSNRPQLREARQAAGGGGGGGGLCRLTPHPRNLLSENLTGAFRIRPLVAETAILVGSAICIDATKQPPKVVSGGLDTERQSGGAVGSRWPRWARTENSAAETATGLATAFSPSAAAGSSASASSSSSLSDGGDSGDEPAVCTPPSGWGWGGAQSKREEKRSDRGLGENGRATPGGERALLRPAAASTAPPPPPPPPPTLCRFDTLKRPAIVSEPGSNRAERTQ